MKQARVSPDYLQNGIIYQMFLRTCTPQGTLEAARKLLPNIASLGTTIVYLCPIFEADDDMDPRYWSERQKGAGTNNPKNPYRMKDFYAIDAEYGTEEDLHAFVKDAHALGMRVWLDMVFFHCGPGAVFLEEHPDWVLRDENGDFVLGEWAFPIHDFKQPALREYLLENMVHWVRDFDVDGFRCDVGAIIPLDFWEEGRRRLEAIKPDVTMLCEGERPDDQLYAFDLNYAFAWYRSTFPSIFSGEQPASILRDVWEKMHAEYPKGARQMRAFDTHGTSDSSSVQGARYEKAWTHAGVDAVLCLSYWIDGVPFLYNGVEAVDESPHCVWADRFHAKNTVVDWSGALTKEGRARTALLRRLAVQRKTYPALRTGETRWIEAGESLLVFARECKEEKLLCAVNLSGNPVAFKAPANGKKIFGRASNGKLPPYGAVMYRIP